MWTHTPWNERFLGALCLLFFEHFLFLCPNWHPELSNAKIVLVFDACDFKMLITEKKHQNSWWLSFELCFAQIRNQLFSRLLAWTHRTCLTWQSSLCNTRPNPKFHLIFSTSSLLFSIFDQKFSAPLSQFVRGQEDVNPRLRPWCAWRHHYLNFSINNFWPNFSTFFCLVHNLFQANLQCAFTNCF